MSRYWIYDLEKDAQDACDIVSENMRTLAKAMGYTVVANTIVGKTEGEINLRAEGTNRWSDIQRFLLDEGKLRWGFPDPYEIRPEFGDDLMRDVPRGELYEPPMAEEQEDE
jgi:hypothetical protein